PGDRSIVTALTDSIRRLHIISFLSSIHQISSNKPSLIWVQSNIWYSSLRLSLSLAKAPMIILTIEAMFRAIYGATFN
uniref:Uncharacterized protein n=1 Tax=Ascaris lumbricoides TaxID=6252 RepID=A0A0M3IFH6_ASCLU